MMRVFFAVIVKDRLAQAAMDFLLIAIYVRGGRTRLAATQKIID
jgi:hypothetical protein